MPQRVLSQVGCRPSAALHALALAAAAWAAPAHAVDVIWSAGDFVPGATAPHPLPLGDTLLIHAGGSKRFIGVDFFNEGLVRWQADALGGGNSAAVVNSGVWQTEVDSNSLVWSFGGQPMFTNTGTFRKTAGINTNVGNWAFANQGGLIDAQVGSITFNGSNNQFLTGSRFSGAGGVIVSGDSSFHGAFEAELLTLAGGTATGHAASFTGGVGGGAGQLRWSGGDLAGNWTLGANGTTTALSGAAKRQVGSNITNHGVLVWDSTATWQGANSAVFTNHGTVEARQSATFTWVFGGQAAHVTTATGTVRATDNSTLTFGNLVLTSDGGLFTADAGSAIVYSGDSNRFNDGTRFVGDQRITGNAVLVGAITSDNLQLAGGTYTGGDGSAGSLVGLMGQARFVGGDLAGHWKIDAAATVTGEGTAAKRQVGSTLTNNGLFVWDTTATLQAANSAVFTNRGTTEVRRSATFNWVFGGQAAFANTATGTVRATGNSTLSFGNLALTSDGGLFTADAGSAIVYNGDSNRFNDGTRFVGDHRITGNTVLVGAITSDNLQLAGGTYTGGDGSPGSQAGLMGQARFLGGDLAGHWKIDAAATVTGEGAAAKRQMGSNVTNDGLFVWDTTATLQAANSAVFTNRGTTEVRRSATFNWVFGGQAAFANNANGTVRATNNSTLTFGNLALTSDGGLFTADAGSAIVYTGSANVFNDGTRFVGDNRVDGGQARYVGAIEADQLRWASGTQIGGDGSPGSSARLNVQVTWEGGDLSGALELAAGSTLQSGPGLGKRLAGGTLVNNGTILWNGLDTLGIVNSGRIENNGRFELTGNGSVTWQSGGQGQLANAGLLIKTGGDANSALSSLALTNTGTLDVRSGALLLPTNFSNAGTLAGTGTFALSGTLSNHGHIAPGASAGTLSINTALVRMESDSVLDIELASLTSHDLLLSNGNVLLDGGTLALHCLGACALAVGDELVILDAAGQLSGSFANVALNGFATGAFDVVYDLQQDRVLLRVTDTVTAVPEAGSAAMLAAGLGVLGWLARRRRRA